MGSKYQMKLLEVIEQLNTLPSETYICVRRPWTADSDVLLVPYSDAPGGISKEVKEQGYAYFLEVDTALEILEGYLETSPTTDKIVEFVIYYAENDAFPDWSFI